VKEKTFHTSTAKLSGNPGDLGWTQVHEFKPGDKEKLQKRGTLYAVISVSLGQTEKVSTEPVNMVSTGREILARLHEEYFGKLETSAFSALKDSISAVVNEFEPSLGHVEIAAISKRKNVVYSAAGGGAQVAVYRKGMLAKILESKKGSVISASGHPNQEDVLLLSTSSFYNYFTEGVIKASLQGKSVREAMESFAPVIHTKDDSYKLGLVLVRFSEESVFISKKVGEEEKGKTDEDKPMSSDKVMKSPVKLFKGFGSRIKIQLPGKRIFVKGAREEDSPKRKTAISTGGILIALLVVSIIFGIIQKQKSDYRLRFEPQLLQAKHEYEEAIGIYGLNSERSRELFVSSRNTVNSLLEQDIEDLELTQLKTDIDANLGRILGEHNTATSLYLDLSLLSDGFSGGQMLTSEGALYILGREGKRVIQVNIENKRTEVVAGPTEIEGITKMAAYSERVFVDKGDIYEVDEEEKKIEKAWGENYLIYAYAGNIYILDKEESVVFRYAGDGSDFGSKQDWLAPGIDIDFSRVTTWTIDGSIWFLFNSGRILKLTRGSPERFEVRGVSPEILSATQIYTNEELKYVYILESTNRVVVIDKEGVYKAQYSSEGIGSASGLAADENEGKILLLMGDRLQEIEMKHL